jgi:hypothetical protein
MFRDPGLVTPILSQDAFPVAEEEDLDDKPLDAMLAKDDELRRWRSICLNDELEGNR